MRLNRLHLKIASTSEEQLQAFALRILVYVGEQKCPWAEEFDGNDYAATHILGTIEGEPVATARIRWFGGFAKLERLAVRAEHRSEGLGRQLLAYLIELSRKKGFTKLYLHAQARLQPFYEAHGFCRIGQRFEFSDHAYVEMVGTFGADQSALSLSHEPHALNRPEGAWSELGILERPIGRIAPRASDAGVTTATRPSLVPSYL